MTGCEAGAGPGASLGAPRAQSDVERTAVRGGAV